jgi:hypothetical protein
MTTRGCRRRAGPRSSRAGCRPTTRPWSPSFARPGCRSSARPTWTSSPWAPRPSTRLRPEPQPVGPRPDPRRLRRRLELGARVLPGAAGHRHRHRWLDPPARRRHRHGRHQADLRRGLALRPGGAGLARPGRPVRPHRARHGPAARGHRWARPAGLDLDQRPGAAGRRGRPPRRRHRHAHRHHPRTDRRRLPGRGAGSASTRPCSTCSSTPAPRSSRSSCPNFDYALAAYYLILPSEASSNLAKFDAMRYGMRVAARGHRRPERRAGHGRHPRRRLRRRGQAAHHPGHLRPPPAATTTPTTARPRRSADSSPTTSRAPSRPPTCWSRRRRRRRPSSSARSSTTRWRCTSTTSRPSRPTSPASRACRCPAGSRPRTGCRPASRSSPPRCRRPRLYAVGAALERALTAAWGGPLLDRAPGPAR